MKGTIKLEHFEKNIYLSNTFAKAARDITSEEYKTFLAVTTAHPDYKIVNINYDDYWMDDNEYGI